MNAFRKSLENAPIQNPKVVTVTDDWMRELRELPHLESLEKGVEKQWKKWGQRKTLQKALNRHANELLQKEKEECIDVEGAKKYSYTSFSTLERLKNSNVHSESPFPIFPKGNISGLLQDWKLILSLEIHSYFPILIPAKDGRYKLHDVTIKSIEKASFCNVNDIVGIPKFQN